MGVGAARPVAADAAVDLSGHPWRAGLSDENAPHIPAAKSFGNLTRL